MNLSINFDSIKITNIVVVSSYNSYTWYMENLYPYYSAVWVFCVEDGVIDNDLHNRLKKEIETNDKINLIIFGIQNYSYFSNVATSRILIMDNIVIKAKLLQLINRAIVEMIVGFCQQWINIERIPNTKNWSNIEVAKKGDIYTLLS